MSSWKRWALAGVAVVAIAAAVTIALVGGGGGHAHRRPVPAGARRGDLFAAARYLDIPLGKLLRELHEGRTMAELARATPGRSEVALVEAIVRAKTARLLPGAAQGERLRRIRARVVVEVQQPYAAFGASVSLVAIAARYLGRSVSELRRLRRAGHSLAAIAAATPGRSAAALKGVLVAERRRAIRTAYARGAISAQAQRRLLAGVERHVGAAISAP